MNKLKKFLYKKLRNQVKLLLTRNLGKVVEEDDRLICYVKKSKCKKDGFNNALTCNAVIDKELANTYNLNKKICYVFEGIDFSGKMFYIYGYNDCEIIIRNCEINDIIKLIISTYGKLTIEDTDIIGFSTINIGATELNINNVNIDGVEYAKELEVVFSSRENINITNSNVGKINSKYGKDYDDLYGNVDNIKLIAHNDIDIKKSKFNGKSKVECISKSGSISADAESLLISKNEVVVEGNNFESININSPKVILNGNKIKPEDDNIQLNNDNSNLILKRIELIDTLKKVKDKIEKTNFEKIEKHYNNLNNQQISRVLKK